ncbi:hypothetical protein F0562_014074 [Nyssa sinensis]|uniref:Helicase-like transcription factor CHR28 n=1 Tax=Nyssa sinensis TaxID=561372 RepID=A0A5J4ZQ09_9ASTE|nr:hypothetical protein F0562_014074 [Nyssa sinensis]
MLMADDSQNVWSFADFVIDDEDTDLSIDLDSFIGILEETPNTSQNIAEELSLKNVQKGLPELGGAPSFGAEIPGSVAFSPYNSEGGSDGSSESAGNHVLDYCGKLEPSVQIGSPVHSCSGSLVDWVSTIPGHGTFSAERDVVSHNASSYSRADSKKTQYEIPNCSDTFGFSSWNANHVSDLRDSSDFNHSKGETEFQFRCSEGETHSKFASHNPLMENSDINYGKYYNSNGTSLESSGTPEIVEASIMDVDIYSHNTYYAPSSFCEIGDHYSALQHCMSADDTSFAAPSRQHLADSFYFQLMSNNEEMMISIKDEVELSTQNECLNSAMVLEAQESTEVGTGSDETIASDLDVRGLDVKCEGSDHISLTSGNSSATFDVRTTVNKTSSQPLPCTLSNTLIGKKEISIKDERNDELVAPQSMACQSFEVSDDAVGDEKEDVFVASKRACHSLDIIDETAFRNSTHVADDYCVDAKASEQPNVWSSTSIRKQLDCTKDERESITTQPENISEAARPNLSPVNGKSLVTSQRSTFDSLHHMGVGGVRPRTNDERLIFRVALQDLSQPKSEASPPDGVLAVPLLRHQRIALSWMVQKETSSLHCSGGILADDQGLGKTVSTIALILKERSPSSRLSPTDVTQNEIETLDLDEDDDSVSELDGSKQDSKFCQIMSNGSSINGRNSSLQAKGRLAAGTLVVCPTSVLRQWADELHNKVTSKANLSVLVYHGSNRTKDPFELAKYDVVLTTYSIVSMEVPKQPLVDKDDDETGKRETHAVMGLSSCKKRKYPPSSNKRSKKCMDSALLESVARPLARVGWFRVVLDEAQSIKNHRTQVARACCGLRAKRRWCLSGTPIQNAVDDLYSYFRFLRYDPYAVYKSFCSTIKVPINRNPTNGYRKLQAVLKTVMLRRTKGTLLDGEPIINLPPKSIELKKVDFTKEERDFYCRLEADSRAQFAKYAAAGTVKQNYVNILLMLLRLRQACDHPFLVNGYDSSSVWRSSLETAKKLPREKLVSLLNCLEASLAICGLCNVRGIPPEDAVVTSCGHVFCNQCICEHLTGDDNQCPTTNCKAQISVSSVFSRETLKSSLSDQPGLVSIPNGFGSELAETVEPCSGGCSFDSSKIKAALEVLQSLSKPRNCTSRTSSVRSIDGSASCPESSSNPHSGGSLREMHDFENLDLDKALNDSIKVVGEKAIVFSQWTRMLDLLEACLKNSSIQYRRLDGTMSVIARDKAVKDFNTLPEVSVMIMSLKAASLGLNMVAACHVILLDLWWNPTTEDQAIDRAHRIGQTRPVTVLRLTVKDTVEDRILALQQKKREMVASAFGEDETGSRQTRLTVEDLKYLFMV